MITVENLTEGDAEHLSTLVEGGLDDAFEEFLIAAQVCHIVASHTDDGTLYLGWGIEDIWLNGKEILHIVPRLNQDRKNAVLLVAWLRSHTDSHLMLDHTRTTGDQILVVEHFEEYL